MYQKQACFGRTFVLVYNSYELWRWPVNQRDEWRDIPASSAWKHIVPIAKGWSKDRKFCVETSDGLKYLLRLSDISSLEQKRAEYETVAALSEMSLNMSMPVAFGVCANGNAVYSLLSWVEGEDAETVLPTLDRNKQAELGRNAGQALRKIHSIPAPAFQPDWAVRFNRKIDRNITNYKNCGVRIPHDEIVLDYIDSHRRLLENRPQTLQHGDFHVGNMIITPQGELAIIDFNRHDFGDPWEEFNRIVWSVHVSKPFATGQVQGYFENGVPDEFFQLMALYICSNTVSSIPWAIPFGEGEVQTMLRNATELLEHYAGFETAVPLWYEGFA
jgi:aminoglycoside phosphotransferase (APT) family kinase protein